MPILDWIKAVSTRLDQSVSTEHKAVGRLMPILFFERSTKQSELDWINPFRSNFTTQFNFPSHSKSPRKAENSQVKGYLILHWRNQIKEFEILSNFWRIPIYLQFSHLNNLLTSSLDLDCALAWALFVSVTRETRRKDKYESQGQNMAGWRRDCYKKDD